MNHEHREGPDVRFIGVVITLSILGGLGFALEQEDGGEDASKPNTGEMSLARWVRYKEKEAVAWIRKDPEKAVAWVKKIKDKEERSYILDGMVAACWHEHDGIPVRRSIWGRFPGHAGTFGL